MSLGYIASHSIPLVCFLLRERETVRYTLGR